MKEGIDLVLVERHDFGVLPEQFMRRFESIESFVKGNKVINRVDILSRENLPNYEGESVELYAVHIKPPMMSTRLMMNAKYYIPSKNTIIISGQGNEALLEAYIAEHKLNPADFTQGYTYISAYHFTPIYEMNS